MEIGHNGPRINVSSEMPAGNQSVERRRNQSASDRAAGARLVGLQMPRPCVLGPIAAKNRRQTLEASMGRFDGVKAGIVFGE